MQLAAVEFIIRHAQSLFLLFPVSNLSTQIWVPGVEILQSAESAYAFSKLNLDKVFCALVCSSYSCFQEAVIDLKLPRRSLLVAFTCDACGERSKRLINRLAYERGLVYVQCSGCSQYHKLVDNLGLVIEYNLQDEIDSSANTDQV
ncbi:hypothetical protein ACS0TY_008256 [Phlomoides rotata]